MTDQPKTQALRQMLASDEVNMRGAMRANTESALAAETTEVPNELLRTVVGNAEHAFSCDMESCTCFVKEVERLLDAGSESGQRNNGGDDGE